MPLPIPLLGFRGFDTHAGTGFLVRNSGSAWLVTCVHLITGLKDTPDASALFAGGRVQVVGTGISLFLFDGVTPRFSVVTKPSGFLADVLAIKLSSMEQAALQPYGAYDLSTVVTPSHDEVVTATGFPGLSQSPIPPTTLVGRVAQIEGLSVKLTVPSAPGYSGSALVGQAGLIGIVHGDVGAIPNLVNGLAISLKVVGPYIFR